MAGYNPLRITGMQTGLVQSREEFLLPNDAYPKLINAYVWRERIIRKQGCKLLGRLQRDLSGQPLGSTDGAGAFSGNIKTLLSLESTGQISPTTLSISVGSQTFTDTLGNGVLSNGGSGTGTINYSSASLTVQTNPTLAATAITASFTYFPGLPVMGLRLREIASISLTPTIAFDTKYAYQFIGSSWSEWIPGTTWTGFDYNFFWTTNFWNSSTNNNPIFWVTNFSDNDPIRYTDSLTWTNFIPSLNSANTQYLQQCLCIAPFRGRLIVFNTVEGPSSSTPFIGSVTYQQRVRWASIGNPLTSTAWYTTPGNGGFIDIPTSEAITSVGFVRDNLVIYCERSTWQLRYTQNAIAPFAIERVNSELGAASTFSAIQFDTSLVGIGDKGVVECDAFKSFRIDPQIIDLYTYFNIQNNGTQRITGVRDFINQLAFWTFPYEPTQSQYANTYPNSRLVYNYENKSWATFTDSYTVLGTFQPLTSITWEEATYSWESQNYPWINKNALILDTIGGNQQGYVEYLDYQTSNDVSLAITDIISAFGPTTLTVPNHNLYEGAIIQISGIPVGTGYESLNYDASTNTPVFAVVPVTDTNTLKLYTYNPATDAFDIPQIDPIQTFVGYGQVTVRDNFVIQSKKFNFMDEGQNIQLGHLDILMNTTSQGGINMNVYLDYNDSTPINILPENRNPSTGTPDTFFNSVIPTSQSLGIQTDKSWHRVFCPVRGSFVTISYNLSNSQMIGPECLSDVQIDAQVLWLRKGGRLQNV
jgi:hypothetical protein